MTAGFDGLAPCVHCGFCLQTCPTFLETGDEAEGPRGRILLMQGIARGDIAPTETSATRHLDRCLGCRACEPVCPSGVEYGPALEEARFLIAQQSGVPALTRFLLTLLTDPLWSRAALFAARRLRPVARLLAGTRRLGFTMGMLAATKELKAGRRKGGKGRHYTLPRMRSTTILPMSEVEIPLLASADFT